NSNKLSQATYNKLLLKQLKVRDIIDGVADPLGGAYHIATRGITNFQIEKYMKQLNAYKYGFQGVVMLDQLHKLEFKMPISFIMNLDTSDGRGTHWVAVNITPDSIEYYNSFARDPPLMFLQDIKKLVQEWPTYFKLKINKIRRQSFTTDTC